MKTTLTLLLSLAAVALPVSAQPVVIAHRGASGYLPEHTLPAKAMAHAMRVGYIEQDLVLTKDDVPVVLHDVYIDTVTDVAKRFPERKRADGRYYAIDFTLAELKQLRVSERFNAKTGAPVYPKRYPSAASPSVFQISTFEEELQMLHGLNRSTGRKVGIYTELKKPHWHREQGKDLSRVVLPILARYGYATKNDACYLQCFEFGEVKRLRSELGWNGRLVMLLEAKSVGDDGDNHDNLAKAAGLAEIAKYADGVGPSLGRLLSWSSAGQLATTTFVRDAHVVKLAVHPYTIRIDDLPKNCPSLEALHAALFRELRIDGVFSDFPDVTLAWVELNSSAAPRAP